MTNTAHRRGSTPKSRPTKRRYDSARRQAQQRETRLQIAAAAKSLFLAHGYAGATIAAIAGKAGVAQETVFAIFGSKRRVLAFVLDIAVAGDDQPVSIIERPEPQAVLRDTDQRRQLQAFASGIAEILARAAAIFEVTRIAAKTEPAIAARVKALSDERMQNMRLVARGLAANGPLRTGLDEAEAAQLLWIITSQDVYLLTTGHLGWTNQRYREWLADTLSRLLLP